jgi:hypothetical protein
MVTAPRHQKGDDMNLRSTSFLIAAAFTLAAGGAGAATMHRFDVSQTSGSAGAVTILQSTPSGGAIQGQVGSSADTGQTIPFGVYGAYSYSPQQMNSPFGIGVVGISQTGYGVAAESFSHSQPSMLAIAPPGAQGALEAVAGSGNTIAELSFGGTAVYGESNEGGYGGEFGSNGGPGIEASGSTAGSFSGFKGDGIDVTTSYGYGLTAGTLGSEYGPNGGHGGSGVVGGMLGQGVIAYGKSGSTIPAMEADDEVGGSDLIGTYAYNGGTPSESFIVQANTANASGHTTGVGKASDVQVSGDLYVSGKVYQTCGAFPETKSSDCSAASVTSVHTANGSDVRMYAASQSLPTVEDLGIAHLSGGRIHVAIDPAFARTMSRERPYHVFLTPDGPSRGVFVTNRSAAGFDIAENPGGNSTVDVEYRIVASPFANRAARLASLMPVRKTVLASELVAARSFSKVREVQDAAIARGRQAQSDAIEQRTKIAEAQAIMAHVR